MTPEPDRRKPDYDVLVLGGGPAGCAAATLLARTAHTVGLIRPTEPPAGQLAESIPPSARRVLEELGALDAVRNAGFHPNRGNSIWWADRPFRREDFADGGHGFHVNRRSLEEVLVQVAEQSGVRVHTATAARSAERCAPSAGRSAHRPERSTLRDTRPAASARTELDGWTVTCEGPAGELHLRAAWVVDATGRKGVLARGDREPDRSTTTLALVRRWRSPDGWGDAITGHTLVESYADGWAWSVPLADDLRCLTVMIDHRHSDLDGRAVDRMLDAELDRTRHVGPLREGCEPAGAAWACPASLYTSSRFTRPGLLLAGDAGSFIDPLSSFGVKKALSSGWLAGVAVHTALSDPSMTEAALDFFDAREREVYRRYRAISADFFAEGAAAHGTEYWRARAAAAERFRLNETRPAPHRSAAAPFDADVPTPLDVDIPEPAVRAAFEKIKSRPALDAVRGPTLGTLERSAIVGHRIVLKDHLTSSAVPEGIRFVRGVDLLRLIEVAPRHDDVPDGWSAYNAVAPPVTLPDYLTALATAFAARLLEFDRTGDGS